MKISMRDDGAVLAECGDDLKPHQKKATRYVNVGGKKNYRLT